MQVTTPYLSLGASYPAQTDKQTINQAAIKWTEKHKNDKEPRRSTWLTKRKTQLREGTQNQNPRNGFNTKNVGDENNGTLGIGRASDVSLEPCKLFNTARSASRAQVRWVLKTLRTRHLPLFPRNPANAGRTRSEESVEECDDLWKATWEKNEF